VLDDSTQLPFGSTNNLRDSHGGFPITKNIVPQGGLFSPSPFSAGFPKSLEGGLKSPYSEVFPMRRRSKRKIIEKTSGLISPSER
jgi:hypothetical protein